MDKRKSIKSLIFLSASLGVLTYLFSDYNYKDNNYTIYEIDDNNPFASYSKGNIYIGNHDYVESIIYKLKPNDILIEQGYKITENGFDPNYKIYSSHLIKDRDDRNAILNVLCSYNSLTCFELNRTLPSMRVEWSVHNILYELGLKQERTKDVDINNADEIIYSNPLLRKLIK